MRAFIDTNVLITGLLEVHFRNFDIRSPGNRQ